MIKSSFKKSDININEHDNDIRDMTASMFALYNIVRGTLNSLGFTHSIKSSTLSNICFNKIIEKMS